MESIMESGVDEIVGPKPKRVAQACQTCSQKKTKCDGLRPTCGRCEDRGEECTYGENRRRKRRHPTADGFNFQYNGSFSNRALNHQGPEEENSRNLPSSSIPPIPQDVSITQFNDYYDYVHPVFPIIYKPMYRTMDFRNPTEMMPMTLALGICAASSPFNKLSTVTNPADEESSNRDLLEDQAYLMVHSGQTNHAPTNTHSIISFENCQALALLAFRKQGLAEYAVADMLFGQAIGMANALRLGQNVTATQTPAQKEVSARLFWCLYVQDKTLAVERGRGVMMGLEHNNCPMPSVNEADEFELSSNPSVKLQTMSSFLSTITLAALMERIAGVVYGFGAGKKSSMDMQAAEEKRGEILAELRKWETDLERTPLALDLGNGRNTAPGSIRNYVMMWGATIYLNRPFILLHGDHVTTGDNNTSPLDACLRAAHKICETMELYIDHLPGFPSSYMHALFMAASVLFFYSKQFTGDGDDLTKRHLDLCVVWISRWVKGPMEPTTADDWGFADGYGDDGSAGLMESEFRELLEFSALRATRPDS